MDAIMQPRPTVAAPLLDEREQHFRITGPITGLKLFLRYLPPTSGADYAHGTVLYVHGGTFPSALSIAHRFDGRSWRDELCAAGYDVWGLDFHGFGASDPYPEMADPADAHAPLGRADTATRQLEATVRFILGHTGAPRLSLVAHSWGAIVAARFAAECPNLVDRLVFFGPIARRPKQAEPARFPAWRIVTLADQWERFTADVPVGGPPVLSRRHFEAWGEAYLDGDPESRTRLPAGVNVPSGPWQDIADADAHAGELGYDLAGIRAPVAIIRGEWDSLSTEADAQWLFDALTASPLKRYVKIARNAPDASRSGPLRVVP